MSSIIFNTSSKLGLAARALLPKNGLGVQPRRHLVLHEFHNMGLLQKAGVSVAPFKVASTALEAQDAAAKLGSPNLVVKAQVLAGARGKGKFTTGLKGGVQTASSPDQVRQIAQSMLGHNLITLQTTEKGLVCQKVLVSKAISASKEFYFAITNESDFNGPVIIASPQGGVDIEEVAKTSPDAILKYPIDIGEGLTEDVALRISRDLGFSFNSLHKACEMMMKLYKVFLKNEALMLEINPMCYDSADDVYCLDVKCRFDDNAMFRHPDLFALQDWSQKDAREKLAYDHNLNFIPLSGQIGCLVNGAGLAMATMDIIQLQGGDPANFLDLGGSAKEDQVAQAFSLVSRDPNVKVILVNIFGGIVQCDVIVRGIMQAAEALKFDIPTVVRLQGSRVKEAKELMASSNLQIHSYDSLEEASSKAVELCRRQPLEQVPRL